MGNPYERRYKSRAASYLKLEGEMTLGADMSCGNLVLDTTGSVIHLDDEILKALKNRYLTVYLKAKDSDIDRLVERFRTTPKPLIWGNHYKKRPDMSDKDSMIDCYRDLLLARDKKYEALADVTVPASSFTKDEDVLAAFKLALPAG
jgi:shikimate kinase